MDFKEDVFVLWLGDIIYIKPNMSYEFSYDFFYCGVHFHSYFVYVAHGQQNENHACLKDSLLCLEKQLYISKLYW